MYRNQYLAVTQVKKTNFHGITPICFNGLYIYPGDCLNTSIATNLSTEILLLGHVINPLIPEASNDEIVSKLVQCCPTQESLFKEVQILSGRYVLIYKNESSFIVIGDACHLKQIYFGFLNENTILTSSPKMFLDYFDFDLKTCQLKEKFINNSLYQKRQSTWYGNKCLDDRLNKLLANHYLDLNKQEVKRIPLYFLEELSSEADIIDFASTILKGTFASLANRYKLIQAVTAGLDSRMLLAASKDFKDKIQYYVFDHSSSHSIPDVWVPNNLARKLKLDFSSIRPGELTQEFLNEYNKENLRPRIVPKFTVNLQYHYYNHNFSNLVNVNGNVSGITKCHYGYTNEKISLEMLLEFSNFSSIEFVRQELDEWFGSARQFAKEFGISVLDLFYWEQRMSHWGALNAFEKDIAIEEITPFNNRSLLVNLLKVKPSRRASPNYIFFKRLIQNLWAETLSEPINPDKKYLKGMIKRNTILRYNIYRAKNLLYKKQTG